MVWPRSRWDPPGADLEFEPPSDARRVNEASSPGRGDPERERRVRIRRGALLLCLATFLVAGGSAALVGRGGYADLHRKREQARALQAEVSKLEIEVSVLSHCVDRLETDPLSRERIAREQLGLILPGEIDFLLPPTDSRELQDSAPGASETLPQNDLE